MAQSQNKKTQTLEEMFLRRAQRPQTTDGQQTQSSASQTLADQLINLYKQYNSNLSGSTDYANQYKLAMDAYNQATDLITKSGLYNVNDSTVGLNTLDYFKNLADTAQLYLQSQNQVNANANSQAVNANVAKDYSSKYMQNVLNSQGLGGQGISETSKLAMNNNYINTLRDVAQNRDNNLFQQQLSFADASNTNNKSYITNLTEAQQAALQAKLTNYTNQIQSISDPTQLNQVLNSAKNDLDESSYNALKAVVDQIKSGMTETVLNRFGITNTNPAASIYGTNYSKSIGSHELSQVQKQVAEGSVSDGEIVLINNKYYLYYNGYLYEGAKNAKELYSKQKNKGYAESSPTQGTYAPTQQNSGSTQKR